MSSCEMWNHRWPWRRASSRPDHHQASFPFQKQAFILLEQKRTTSLAYSFNITSVFNRLVLVACYIYPFELLPVLVMRHKYLRILVQGQLEYAVGNH